MPGQPMLVHLDDEEAERTAEVSGAIDVFSSALLPMRALAAHALVDAAYRSVASGGASPVAPSG